VCTWWRTLFLKATDIYLAENFASHATDPTRRDKARDRAQSIRSLVSTYASIARCAYFAMLLSERGWERNRVLADFNLTA